MFRREAIIHGADRLAGEVVLPIPVSWQAIGYLLLIAVAGSGLFISLAKYDRVESASGAIVPDTGISTIVPSRPGVVSSLQIRDGDVVRAGDRLATIRADEDLETGKSVATLSLFAAQRQDASLAAQDRSALAAGRAQVAQITAARAGLLAQIAELRGQVVLQERLVSAADDEAARVQEVAKRGFISGRDVSLREAALIERKQQLSQLRLALQEKLAGVTEADRNLTQAAEQSAAGSAAISAQRAQLAQQLATIQGAGAYVLRAPVAGMVTGLAARVGQHASPEAALMSIMPVHSTLRAEIWVPSAAVGFLRPGQHVKLAIDAFSYQRFGTVRGRLATIAATAVERPTAEGTKALYYPATVILERTSVDAYGRRHQLIPGMSLTARIITERRSLLELLFDPLLAVRNR